jgi:hypothetical protein
LQGCRLLNWGSSGFSGFGDSLRRISPRRVVSPARLGQRVEEAVPFGPKSGASSSPRKGRRRPRLRAGAADPRVLLPDCRPRGRRESLTC